MGQAHCQVHGQSWSLCQSILAELGEGGDGWMQGTAVGCQRPRRGLGKVAEDAGITRSHPHSSHTTNGPASANGREAAVRG